MKLRELSLFTGGGGSLYAGALVGWEMACAVEWDRSCQAVLRARIEDGAFPPFEIYGDVAAFDGKPWRGKIDLITAGFPCQPLSLAGKRRASSDMRDGWPHTRRIIGEVQPEWVFLENARGILSAEGGQYFRGVCHDLDVLGYESRWTILSAADVGAPHPRQRWWMLARRRDCGPLPAARQLNPAPCSFWDAERRPEPTTPRVGPAEAKAQKLGARIKMLGNGWVPLCAAAAWATLGGPRA